MPIMWSRLALIIKRVFADLDNILILYALNLKQINKIYFH